MAGTQDVPGSQDGGVQTAGANNGFDLRPNLDVRLHEGSRLGHTHIDKMLNSALSRSGNSETRRGEIDLAKQPSLRWTRVGDAHELHKGIGRRNVMNVRV